MFTHVDAYRSTDVALRFQVCIGVLLYLLCRKNVREGRPGDQRRGKIYVASIKFV
jgi:hypothetical protein